MKRMLIFVGLVLAVLMLCIGCAVADGGTFHGLTWDLTDGVLTLGRTGETQSIHYTSNGWPWRSEDNRLSITSVETEGQLVFTGSLDHMFYRCDNLTSIDTEGWNTSGVTTMSYMFGNLPALTSLDLSGFDTSNVTSMSAMFQSDDSLQTLILGEWNTSKVTNMWTMFSGCKSLAAVDVADWDVSNVTTMYGMFAECASLTEVEVSGWDTHSATNLDRMFLECSKLSSLDLSGWDVSHVTAIGGNAGNSGMFNGCTNLTSLNVSTWDTSSVTNMGATFAACSKLRTLDISGWVTNEVTNMYSMFSGDRLLTTVDVSHFNTSKVTNMVNMFYGCGALQDIAVSGFNTSSLCDMEGMFENCAQLVSLDLSGWDVSRVTSLKRVFAGCVNLVSLDVSSWNTSNVTMFSEVYYNDRGTFYNCQKLVDLDVSNWDVSKVMCMRALFLECESLPSLDLSKWDVSSVTNMSQMFQHCYACEQFGVETWNVGQVTTMSYMFDDCKAISTLDLSNWNTSRVTDMQQMFCGCLSLKTLNISGFNTSSVTSFNSMYSDCKRLDTVILGEHNPMIGSGTAKVTLPTPPTVYDGVRYTGKWVREDGTAGPYTPEQLRNNYTSSMAGTWVWEKVPTKYTLSFSCEEEGCVGAMPTVMVDVTMGYQLPMNVFKVFGKVFDHWTDGTRRVYRDGDTIPANTYRANAEVVLTAVFAPRNTSIVMNNGAFEFSIKGDEKAFFDNVPAGTSYQVFEENLPEDWVLIAQSNTTGLVESLEESNAIVLNKYQPDMATIQFTGRKLMDEQPAIAGSFTFELWEGNILLQTKSVIEGGFVQFDMLEYDRNDVGIHTYIIKELVGSDETVLYDGHEETIAVEVTAVEDIESNVTRVHAEVTYSDGTYPNILFENWTKPGELSLKKLVDELLDGHQNDEFKFRITFKQEDGLPLSDVITYSIIER